MKKKIIIIIIVIVIMGLLVSENHLNMKPTIKSNNNTTANININTQIVAKIGDIGYETLQSAIDNVINNNDEATTIYVIKNIKEDIEIEKGKRLVLEMGDYTLTNNEKEAISNYGYIKIESGYIESNYISTINNHGEIEINKSAYIINNYKENETDKNGIGIYNNIDGKIKFKGNVISYINQAIYNEGYFELQSGSVESMSMQHASIYNSKTGNMFIIDGNAISNYTNIIINDGTMEITGNINMWSENLYAPILNNIKGNLVLKGGYILSTHANTIINAGNMEIKDDAFIINSGKEPTIWNKTTGNLTINGGEFSENERNIIKNEGHLEIGEYIEMKGTYIINNTPT